MRAVVFGSANLDRTYRVDHIVSAGETLSCRSMSEACGGKGFNQAIALARGGIATSFAGAIGSDGAPLVRMLEEAGVDTSHLMRREGPSGHAIIQLDDAGTNCIVVCAGANGTVTEADVDAVLADFEAGDLLVVQNEMSSTPYAIRAAHKREMIIAANPSPCDERIKEWDIGCVDYLFVNEGEAAALSHESEPEAMLARLHELYPDICIILTLGEEGSLCTAADGSVLKCPAEIVDAVDTTGAGDTFTGYFLAEVMVHAPLSRALAHASAASALCVTRHGAAPSIPTREEVLAWKHAV